MEIDQEEQTPYLNRERPESIETSQAFLERDIEGEVPKKVIELGKHIVLEKTPTIFIPYPSLEFTMPQKEKDLTQTGHIIIQPYLQSIYRDIIKGIV